MAAYITRTERSGSIFYRITGLLKTGQMQWRDRPIWYDVYAACPPHQEPLWDIKMPRHGEPIRSIMYPEDVQRAAQFKESRIEAAAKFAEHKASRAKERIQKANHDQNSMVEDKVLGEGEEKSEAREDVTHPKQ
uniref:MRP-S23 domain-containing protein n=1 Tax=Rhabditophanes sp. KR3021 TaxID=114890 RepID=A0AC35U133_9BILA